MCPSPQLTSADWQVVAKLWHDFDPIGVFVDPNPDNLCPDDEYDNYAQPTLDLLNQNASRQELTKYITYISCEYIGMSGLKDEYINEFVDKLFAWNKQRGK
jgi:hypothetical protein